MMEDITGFGILVNNIVCYIRYNPFKLFEYNKNIPEFILQSWLYNSRGWYIAESATINIFRSSLLSYSFVNIKDFLKLKGNKEKKQFFQFMENKFGKELRTFEEDADESDDNQYFEMRCLLDTRNQRDYSPTGYQIFTSSHNQKCNLFVIKNADYQTIKMLENPADVIDSYAAHVFETHNTDFDFMKYTVDF